MSKLIDDFIIKGLNSDSILETEHHTVSYVFYDIGRLSIKSKYNSIEHVDADIYIEDYFEVDRFSDIVYGITGHRIELENKISKSSNGLTMVESYPFKWLRKSVYAGSSDEPYLYFIHLGGINDSKSCVYSSEAKVLNIDDLKFKVNSLEEAGNIVLKLVEAYGYDLSETIYEI